MIKTSRLTLVAFLTVMALIIPVTAAAPGHMLTGGGWFISDYPDSSDDTCNFAISAREISGTTWDGHCVLMDRDSGEKVVIDIESLDSIDGTDYKWIWLLGTGRLYVDNVLTAEGDIEIYYELDDSTTPPNHNFLINFYEDAGDPDYRWGTWYLDRGNLRLR